VTVRLLDDPAFADGFGAAWDIAAAADAIDRYIRTAQFKWVITFDQDGVSQHPNHRDVHRAVRRVALDHSSVPFLVLRTVSQARAFTANLEVLAMPLLCDWLQPPGGLLFWTTSHAGSWRSMRRHGSQWRWFRKLFVVCSRYSYVNQLDPLSSLETAPGSPLPSERLG